MKFYESGLPDDPTLEAAFNYSYANIMASQADALKGFAEQINLQYEQYLSMLDADKNAKVLSDEDYKKEKENLERMRDENMKMGPLLIEQELNNTFEKRRLGPARELQEHSDKPTPEVLAAVMLVDCVRSPVDYKRVAQKFGENIAGLVAEVQHIDAYPSERSANLAQAGSDTKRAYMALLVTSLDQIVDQINLMAKASPTQKIVFPPGQEETLFGNAQLLWGNDKKLEQRFVEAFNRTAEATASRFRIELDKDGKPELTKGSLTPPPRGPRGPKPPGGGTGSLGDDVF